LLSGQGEIGYEILYLILADHFQLIWFLVPTVALCLQQHEVIISQMPSVKTRILTGMDNVDRWTDQGIWDTVLKSIRVVVSTHAVLADALGHGFVQMSQLALLVFDEGRKTSRIYYWPVVTNMRYSSSL
jgi:ERCC4-related helicase